jgi:pimeloyl-ACP methyl ester carboxylesterase
MPHARANGIRIEYETFGDPAAPAMLLIMGLGGQLIHWPEAFCRQLSERGLRVIRYDNRDTGLSSTFEKAGAPDFAQAAALFAQGEPLNPPYTIEDMADDAAGLLDALGIEKAHVCGMSMGGMIAQTLAIRHPSRVLSLTSVFSSTGDPNLPPPRPDALEALTAALATEREAFIEQTLRYFRIVSGPGLPFDEAAHRAVTEKSYDRSFIPTGAARQMLAIMAQGNRKPMLAAVTAPTLVIHGDADPVVPLEAGKDTVEAIPGARLQVIRGMGHELPLMNRHWLTILDLAASHAQAAGTKDSLK